MGSEVLRHWLVLKNNAGEDPVQSSPGLENIEESNDLTLRLPHHPARDVRPVGRARMEIRLAITLGCQRPSVLLDQPVIERRHFADRLAAGLIFTGQHNTR